MNTQSAREQVNRNILIDTCLVVLKEHGLRGLKMNYIIEESGLSRRTVYKYFANKQDLVRATFHRESLRYYEDVKGFVSQCASVEDIFVQGFLYTHKTLPDNPVLIALITDTELLQTFLGTSDKSLMETLLDELELDYFFEEYPSIKEEIFELSQYWVQTLASFLLLGIGRNMTQGQIETYVRKRFVPGLQLDALLEGL